MFDFRVLHPTSYSNVELLHPLHLWKLYSLRLIGEDLSALLVSNTPAFICTPTHHSKESVQDTGLNLTVVIDAGGLPVAYSGTH